MQDLLNRIKVFSIYFVIGIFPVIFLYIFETAFVKNSQNMVESWLSNESNKITEGNLLSSFTNAERWIEQTHQFSGISLYSENTAGNSLLLSIGNPMELPKESLIRGQNHIVRRGIFSFYLIYPIGGPNGHIWAVFQTSVSFWLPLLLIITTWVLIFVLYLVYFSRKNSIEKFLLFKSGLNSLINDQNDNEFLKQEATQFMEVWTETQNKLKSLQEKALNFATEKKMNEISKQVAHDIRSPLAALNMIANTLHEVPEDKRIMLRSSIQRINDIANDLLSKGKQSRFSSPNSLVEQSLPLNSNLQKEVILLPALVDSLVSEKRIQFRDQINVQIQSELFSCIDEFVLADRKELMRVLSNLINNSIEAFDDRSGIVTVTISSNSQDKENWVSISITDNGKGIPPHILSKLGESGVSFGKNNSQSGSGIGVYHAKKTIENLNGKFEINSQLGKGTEIIIYLPRIESPAWFLKSIKIPFGSEVISLDDDISIHHIWKERLSNLRSDTFKIKLNTFTSANEFKKYLAATEILDIDRSRSNQINRIYLIDFELLGQNTNGLKIIDELNINLNVILVTSRYEELQIQEKCTQLGIKLLPKQFAGSISIEIANEPSLRTDLSEKEISVNANSNSLQGDFGVTMTKYDWVLIDDDPLVHLTWNFVAEEKNKIFIGFKSFEEFKKEVHRIDRNSNIYIDSNLGNGIKGEEIAKVIYSENFCNLFLTTGYDKSGFNNLHFIKAIIGKEPPI